MKKKKKFNNFIKMDTDSYIFILTHKCLSILFWVYLLMQRFPLIKTLVKVFLLLNIYILLIFMMVYYLHVLSQTQHQVFFDVSIQVKIFIHQIF